MRGKRILRRLLVAFGALLAVALVLFGAGWWYLHPGVERIDGVEYGRRNGKALTMDVLRAPSPNGRGVMVLVSGSWRSKRPGDFEEWIAAPLLRRGYTVFAVCHVSQPQATVMEIVADLTRAVRFVLRARDFSYLDEDRKPRLDAGEIQLHVGASARAVDLARIDVRIQP